MASLIPAADRAPSLASRVVTIHSTNVTEGAPAPGKYTFSLPCALRVPADDVILQPGSVTVGLTDGRGEVRLPVYSTAVTTTDGSSDWVIVVHPPKGDQYAIRVPAGSSAVSLADLPAVRPLTRREAAYAITSVGVTVTEGTAAGGSVSYANGNLDFRIQVPPFRPATVYPYIDATADARAQVYEQRVLGSVDDRLETVTTAYEVAQAQGYTGTVSQWLASLVGPKGDKGDTGNRGATGPANSLSVGTVTTGAPGSAAAATITGTAPSQTLGLTIPRGDKGEKGDKGDTGSVNDVPWASVTGKPATFPPATHSHAQADVTGLGTALAGKASVPGTWSQLTLQGAWAPISSGVYTYGMQARITPAGLQVVGIVKDGATGAIIANLPAGVTPAYAFPFACEASSSSWGSTVFAMCTVNQHSGTTWSIQYNSGPATASHHLGINVLIPLT